MNLWRLAVGASLRPVLWTLGVASLLFVGFFNLLGEPVLRNLSGQGMLGSQLIYTPVRPWKRSRLTARGGARCSVCWRG